MKLAVQENVLLAPHTYFKIGGPARFFVRVESAQELEEALLFAETKKLPIFLLAGGSNILVSDDGFSGLVIKMNIGGIEHDGKKLLVGAGVPMAEVVRKSVELGLSGFEWAIGIPGTIGGSVRGNAGCFGQEMKDVVEHVTVLKKNSQVSRGKCEISNAECEFAYRDSIFKRYREWVILSATLMLQEGNSLQSQELIKEYTKKRVWEQDIGAKCAGCIFKNLTRNDGVIMRAGELIDKIGLKGYSIGQAMVSEKHANYFINLGGASAYDVKKLIEFVKKKIFEKYNIHLEEEIQYVGDF